MTNPPSLHIQDGAATLAGEWTLATLLPSLPKIERALAEAHGIATWNLNAVARLDSTGAALLWRAWGGVWPRQCEISGELRQIVARVAAVPADETPVPPASDELLVRIGRRLFRIGHEAQGMVTSFGQLLLDLAHLGRHPGDIPWREFSATLYKAGAQALPVSALVGFLIGITVSYLSALQLKIFGADLFIINLLGISIVRELGPVLVAVLVAGRSGSAMTAQIGVMRVTEEIDALAAMGISRSLRLVLPKVAALTLAMPLLVLWTSVMALLGGMLAAYLQLDLSPAYFLESLPRAVPVANLYIGLGKGLAFGFLIALIACHAGLHVRPNTESLSAWTTAAVVRAITMVILVDAVFAVLTRNFGMPRL